MNHFIVIDEDGYINLNGVRATDEYFGREVFENFQLNERGVCITKSAGTEALVEPFDAPLVALQVAKPWKIQAPYHFTAEFDPHALMLDEWDRFHGLTKDGIPFVFSRAAQNEFFNLVDEFDDDSITIDGEKIMLPSWLPSNTDAEKENFWTNIYQNETPTWELGAAAAALSSILPQIKLPKCRVLVLGCGSGNDAAYFAEQGHVVTGVDISPEAIARAKDKYGQVRNLTFIQSDIFKLGPEHNAAYDLVFEHTCYCAINPSQRTALVKLWKRVLAEEGHLLGVFFAMEKRTGPPYGGSEWEIRQRLKNDFEFHYWTRWRHSIEQRKGREVVIYAKKKET